MVRGQVGPLLVACEQLLERLLGVDVPRGALDGELEVSDRPVGVVQPIPEDCREVRDECRRAASVHHHALVEAGQVSPGVETLREGLELAELRLRVLHPLDQRLEGLESGPGSVEVVELNPGHLAQALDGELRVILGLEGGGVERNEPAPVGRRLVVWLQHAEQGLALQPLAPHALESRYRVLVSRVFGEHVREHLDGARRVVELAPRQPPQLLAQAPRLIVRVGDLKPRVDGVTEVLEAAQVSEQPRQASVRFPVLRGLGENALVAVDRLRRATVDPRQEIAALDGHPLSLFRVDRRRLEQAQHIREPGIVAMLAGERLQGLQRTPVRGADLDDRRPERGQCLAREAGVGKRHDVGLDPRHGRVTVGQRERHLAGDPHRRVERVRVAGGLSHPDEHVAPCLGLVRRGGEAVAGLGVGHGLGRSVERIRE